MAELKEIIIDSAGAKVQGDKVIFENIEIKNEYFNLLKQIDTVNIKDSTDTKVIHKTFAFNVIIQSLATGQKNLYYLDIQ